MASSGRHSIQAEIMDQPTTALIADLKRRGMLEHTLVVWAAEFGRMPSLQADEPAAITTPEPSSASSPTRGPGKASATARATSSVSRLLEEKKLGEPNPSILYDPPAKLKNRACLTTNP